MDYNSDNTLIFTPAGCVSNCREAFLFVFNSSACTCRNAAAGRDDFVNS